MIFQLSMIAMALRFFAIFLRLKLLFADYVFRADEFDWPPYFVTAVEYVMAGVLAVSVARDSQFASSDGAEG